MLSQLTKDITNIPENFTTLLDGKFDAAKATSVAATFGNSTTDYEHQILAGRLLIYSNTRACQDIDSYLEAYKHRLNKPTALFMKQYKDEINTATQEQRHLEYDQYDFFSASCLLKQYLLKTFYNEEPLESIQMMHMRQAVQFYHHRGIKRVLQCYREMSEQYYTHATPTVCNAGTTKNQESSCFLIPVADDMDDIAETVHTISTISKLNGGVGIGADEFRHSEIGYVGVSEGPIGFLSMYDKTISKVRQGNTRNGAGTAFLSSWHYDFDDFVKMTDNFREDRFQDLNTCCWMNDLFFKRVQNAISAEKNGSIINDKNVNLKTEWTLFCPKKAETLKGKSGIDFIREYEKMEILAEKRESEYNLALKEVKRLHTLLMSTPENKVLQEEYLAAREAKVAASKAKIDHKKINAYQLYKTITNTETNSGMPYVMHADACQKSNQKNLGYISQSNLCLEILEVTKPHTEESPASIASCNLASMNITRHVKGKLDWTKEYTTPESTSQDLCKAFDFTLYAKNVRSVVENLNEVIDHNYYPLDQRDKNGKVIEQGPISTTNLKTRPLGIGVSGQSDALAMMDCTYLGKPATMFNKMLYACKYFNCLLAGMALSIRDGAYEEFKTGSYRSFIGIGKKDIHNNNIADENGFITLRGSPLFNGKFQFDLWKEEAAMLKAHGLLNEKVYDTQDDKPINPKVWGQQTTYIYVVPLVNKNKTTNDYEITTTQRRCKDKEIEICVYPEWDHLRDLIMQYGVRNSLYVAIMPTASSANTLRNCESTEAHQSMIYTRDVKAGSFTILNRHLYYALHEINLWSSELADFIAACEGTIKHIKSYILDHPENFPHATFDTDINNKLSFPHHIEKRLDHIMSMFKNMYDMSQKEILHQVRQRGIYVCQSQSTNIYLKDPTSIQLEALHLYTNALRIKTGVYYLRQSPAQSAGNFVLPAQLLAYVKNLFDDVVTPRTSSPLESVKSNKASPIGKMCSLENKDCIDCMV